MRKEIKQKRELSSKELNKAVGGLVNDHMEFVWTASKSRGFEFRGDLTARTVDRVEIHKNGSASVWGTIKVNNSSNPPSVLASDINQWDSAQFNDISTRLGSYGVRVI